MKSLKYVLILLLITAACKSNKNVVETSVNLKKMAARKVVKKHLANQFSANTLESKIKVRYTNNRGSLRKRHQITVRLRMIKDSVIWMRGNKAITVFKAKATPTSFAFYSPISKEYFEGDYSLLEKILGVKLTFNQLQDLFLGKSIHEIKGNRITSEVDENSYKLTPKTQEELFDIFLRVNPKHFKLNQLLVINEEKQQTLRINYSKYNKLKDDLIPMKVEINATEAEDAYTWVNMEYRSLKLNEPVKLPFRIPKGYKRIEL